LAYRSALVRHTIEPGEKKWEKERKETIPIGPHQLTVKKDGEKKRTTINPMIRK